MTIPAQPTKIETPIGSALMLRMDRDKETKNAYRFAEYTEYGERGFVGSIYLLKEVARDLGIEGQVCLIVGPPALADLIQANTMNGGTEPMGRRGAKER